MNDQSKWTRRVFLGRSAWGTAAAGMGIAKAQGAAPGVDNPWRYDVDRLRQVDAAWLKWQREAMFAVGHPAPRRLVWSGDDTLCVAAGRTVRRLNLEGGLASEVVVGDLARAVRVTPSGELWVALPNRVDVYAATGERIARWPAFSGQAFLTGLAVGEQEVWVADSGNRVVYRCDRQGRIELRLGERDASRGVAGLVLPSPYLQVELAEDGTVWWNNAGRHKIERSSRDGEPLGSWGRPGAGLETFCGCCNPVGFALMPGGGWVTAEKGLPRVKVYREDGTLESVVAAPDAFAPVGSEERPGRRPDTHHEGLDVAVSPAGRVAVLDLVGAQVQVYRRRPEGGGAA